ncbi:hypothetical protein ACHAXR_008845 [Thalassiosira sp. AJA248-18]
MTSVLRDSLGGNCKTIVIAAISPEPNQTDESISTCHFAQRVALVKNSASVNEEVEPGLVIQRLRAEVRRLREEVEFLSGKNNDDDSSCEEDDSLPGKLPQHQMDELSESSFHSPSYTFPLSYAILPFPLLSSSLNYPSYSPGRKPL